MSPKNGRRSCTNGFRHSFLSIFTNLAGDPPAISSSDILLASSSASNSLRFCVTRASISRLSFSASISFFFRDLSGSVSAVPVAAPAVPAVFPAAVVPAVSPAAVVPAVFSAGPVVVPAVVGFASSPAALSPFSFSGFSCSLAEEVPPFSDVADAVAVVVLIFSR